MRLDVWLDGYPYPAGTLESYDNGAVRFRYAPDYLRGHPLPLSLSLPLQEAEFEDACSRAFFDNLLPENDQVQGLIEREGLSRDDLVGIFYHMGADCSGAISCLPEGAPPVKVPGDLAEDYEALTDDQIIAIMTSLVERQRLPDDTQDPSPLAGVQSKMALTLLPDGRWALPKPGRKVPSTHILKVPSRADQSDVKLEWAASVLARGAGLTASVPKIIASGKATGLLSERFDRLVSGNTVVRLHQEDFAQALGLPRGLKYQRNGRYGRQFDAVAISALLDETALPAETRRRFLLATLFNLAVGNNDNHAKNHALLYVGSGIPHFAPLYDLMPTRMNGRYTERLAFDIGSAQVFEAVTAENLMAFFAAFGLEGGRSKRFIQGAIKPMLGRLENLCIQLTGEGLKTFDDQIGQNLSHLNEVLDLGLKLRERDYFTTKAGGWAGS